MSVTKLTFLVWIGSVYGLFLAPDGICQQPEKTFSHLTVDDGLSQSSVYAITQDRRGFMWFGTRNGLNRYDSRKVTVYHAHSATKNSLASNTINSLLLDKKGQLLVGSSKGLAIYRPETDDFQRISPSGHPKSKQPDSTINYLFQDHSQQIWVGTQSGLYRLQTQNHQSANQLTDILQYQPGIPNPHVRTLYEDRDQNLWVGTASGITRLQPTAAGTYKPTTYFLSPSDSIYPNTANSINAIAEDKLGRLWIGTEGNGLILFDRKRGQVIPWNTVSTLDLSTQTIRTIKPDGKGNFWVGTMAGLYIIAQDGSHFKSLTNQPADPGSLSDNSIRSIFRDRDGSFWVGTYYGGVDLFSPLARQFGSFHPLDTQGRTPFKIAGAMLPASTSNQLWLGTEDRGLFLINPDKTIARHYTHDAKNSHTLSNDKVKCLLADGSNGLWIGTLKGLNYLDLRRQTITRYLHEPNNPHSLPNDRIYDLRRDAQGTLWIVTNLGGLCRFDPKTQGFEPITFLANGQPSISSINNMCLLIDTKARMWLGTTGGLYVRKAAQPQFIHFAHNARDSSSLSSNSVSCFLEDRQHRIWVGTRDNGLNLLLPDQRSFRRFTAAQGLISNSIVGIQEDSRGRLWISTDKGLAQFDPRSATFSEYDKHDGLVCKEFTNNSTYQDSRGYLYFGGYNGIIYFHPDSIRRNTTIHPLAFTQLRLFNEPVTNLLPVDSSDSGIDYSQELSLTHLQNVFSLDFAAFNYINAAKNRYAYKLVGFDNTWNYVSDPSATYMNLPAGDYVLQVKGANNDNIWSPKPLELKISVLPPLWKTSWAYIGYVLLFLGLLNLWSRFNRNRLQLAHDLRVEHTEKIRQQELHQTKLNFFTEIAHEIRTPLTLVMAPIEVLSDRYADDPFIRKQLSSMRGSADRLLRLLNQLLDFRKHETGNIQLHWQQTDLVAFLSNITDSFREHAQSRQIILTNESDVSTLPAWFDAGELEKVVYNLLLNAVKFTPAGGLISIQLHQAFDWSPAEGQAIITIEDTGSGIPANALNHIFNQFYQVDQHKTHDTGFGLGLALSKHIVEQHKGTISVESQESRPERSGFTRFTIALPLARPAVDEQSVLVSKSVLEPHLLPVQPLEFAEETDLLLNTDEQPEPPRPLLLIVDDQDDIRAYIRDLFVDNCQVIEAANGALAWEKASQLLPDLIIADVAMPVMDGFALTQRIKSDPRTSHIPLILLTAKEAIDNQLTGLQTGADDYLTKPFHPILLQARVRNLLMLREKLKAKYHQFVTLQPQAQELDHPDEKFLNQLMTVLDTHLQDAEFNVTSLVGEMGMSRPVLFRKVKMLTGLSVIDLLRTTRLKKAELLLKQRKASVAEIAFAVGFSDPKYFSRAFRAQFGLTPTEYSQQAIEEMDEVV